ncbi:MAG TPA: hypothetical protein VFF94_08570, partial [Novosphingobium sp.]|nr:hypothetical protein [Novosphingobium sp.]
MNPPAIDSLWYTRCPVPSASGIAIEHDLLAAEFAPDGIAVRPITDAPQPQQEAHFDHGLAALFREGGNVPAMAARAAGAATVLIGLTFVPEFQAIAVLPDAPFQGLADLADGRLLVPDHGAGRVDFFAAMSLRGYHNAFAATQLPLPERLVRIPRPKAEMGQRALDGYDWELAALRAGAGDAISIKGALGADLVLSGAVRVIWQVDPAGAAAPQINNGTPRAITVSARLAQASPDLVTRYLITLLRAAEWGKRNPEEVARIVSRETGATLNGVHHAYGPALAAAITPSFAPD